MSMLGPSEMSTTQAIVAGISADIANSDTCANQATGSESDRQNRHHSIKQDNFNKQDKDRRD